MVHTRESTPDFEVAVLQHHLQVNYLALLQVNIMEAREIERHHPKISSRNPFESLKLVTWELPLKSFSIVLVLPTW